MAISKAQQAKNEQGYVSKAIPKTCHNCKSFEFDSVQEDSRYGTYSQDKNLRCGIGGFAVKKMGTCNKFEMRTIHAQ